MSEITIHHALSLPLYGHNGISLLQWMMQGTMYHNSLPQISPHCCAVLVWDQTIKRECWSSANRPTAVLQSVLATCGHILHAFISHEAVSHPCLSTTEPTQDTSHVTEGPGDRGMFHSGVHFNHPHFAFWSVVGLTRCTRCAVYLCTLKYLQWPHSASDVLYRSLTLMVLGLFC